MGEPRKTLDAQDIFLFKGLPSEQKRAIAASLPEAISYPKGGVIYRTDRFERALGVVLSGAAEVRNADAGRPVVMRRLFAGDAFGAAALFGGDCERYVSVIEAKRRTRVLFLTQERLRDLILQYPAVAERYIVFLSERIRFLNRRISRYTGGTAEQRVLQFARQHHGAQGKIAFPNKAELARRLDISRSGLYEALRQLQAQDELFEQNRTWYINLNKGDQ